MLLCGSHGGAPSARPPWCFCLLAGWRVRVPLPPVSLRNLLTLPRNIYFIIRCGYLLILGSPAVFETTSLSKKTRGLCQEHLFLVCVCARACVWRLCTHTSVLTGSLPPFPMSPEEGNGNPLLCSCLENPRDRGVWWAAIYGVAQNWT